MFKDESGCSTKPQARERHRSLVTQGLCAVIFLAFLVQSSILAVKYFAKQKTLARSFKHVDSAKYPAISLCPGFKTEEVLKHGWFLQLWENIPQEDFGGNDTIAESPARGTDIWKNATIELEEFLDDMIVPHQQEYITFSSKNLTTGWRPEFGRIRRWQTTSGKCYTISLEAEVKRYTFLTMRFNLMALGGRGLNLFLHHPDNTIGLNSNYWMGPVETVILQPASQLDILLRPEMIIAELPDSVEDESQFYRCVEEKLKTRPAISYHNCGEFCYFPAFDMLLNLTEEMPKPCHKATDFICSAQAIKELLDGIINPEHVNCPLPSAELRHHLKLRDDGGAVLKGTRAVLFIGFESTTITFEKEYLLMDFFQLMSSLGGSLGMFIGWSLLHGVHIIVDVLVKLRVLQ